MDGTSSRCRVEPLAAFCLLDFCFLLLGAPTSSLVLSYLARRHPAQAFLQDLHGRNRQQVSCRTLGRILSPGLSFTLSLGHRQAPPLFLSFLANMVCNSPRWCVIPSVSGPAPLLPAPLVFPSHCRPTALETSHLLKPTRVLLQCSIALCPKPPEGLDE